MLPLGHHEIFLKRCVQSARILRICRTCIRTDMGVVSCGIGNVIARSRSTYGWGLESRRAGHGLDSRRRRDTWPPLPSVPKLFGSGTNLSIPESARFHPVGGEPS